MSQEKSIEIGSYVKYTRSDTKGTVTEIKKDEDGIWVLIDTTNLYYKIELVEVIEKYTEKVVKQLKSAYDSTITNIKEKKTSEDTIAYNRRRINHIDGYLTLI